MPEPWGTGEESEQYAESAAERLYRVVLDAIRDLLEEMRRLILPSSGAPDLGTWTGSAVWAEWLESTLPNTITRIVRGAAGSGTDTGVITRYAADYIREVQDRLRDWPDEAFAAVREVLEYGYLRGDDTTRLRERVGDALQVTALTQDTQEQIDRLYDRIERGVSPDHERALRSQIRSLYATQERDRRMWEWRADRIARTETTGAVSAGVLAFGEARPDVQWRRQWWSSRDGRVRETHRVAHGQIVSGLFQPFVVGGAALMRPGDPLGPPQEVINCRCSMLLLGPGEELLGAT